MQLLLLFKTVPPFNYHNIDEDALKCRTRPSYNEAVNEDKKDSIRVKHILQVYAG